MPEIAGQTGGNGVEGSSGAETAGNLSQVTPEAAAVPVEAPAAVTPVETATSVDTSDPRFAVDKVKAASGSFGTENYPGAARDETGSAAKAATPRLNQSPVSPDAPVVQGAQAEATGQAPTPEPAKPEGFLQRMLGKLKL